MKKTVATLIAFAIIAGFNSRADVPRPEYPRPQFERNDWVNLNGTWTYTFDFGKSGGERGFENFGGFDGRITVPFCPESKLSGVEYKDFINCMWYQRSIDIPAGWDGKRVILHFGAVDYACEVYVNGNLAGRHWGGTVSFQFDVTGFVSAGQSANLVLRVLDDTRSSVQPGGKQCKGFNSSGCHYTRTTGIWQTVWMEAVSPFGLESVYVKPDLDNSSFVFQPCYSSLAKDMKLRIKVLDGQKVVATSTSRASAGQTVVVPVKKAKTWSPESPFLYGIVYEVLDADGNVLDQVSSYAGMRKIHIEGNRIYLNNKPLYLRMVLDQGFYPDGVWTAPSDEELRNDILRSQAVGFNAARLHQKVFEERFHYWADKLGYLTWGESSSWGIDENTELAARNFIGEWQEIVLRDRNHPSIIAWTPFNETWSGKRNPVYERLASDVYTLTHSLDYRPVNDASGGCHVVTDIWTYHNYNQSGEGLKWDLTPAGDGSVPTWDRGKECPYTGQPYLIDEYGGIKWVVEQYSEISWGYGQGPQSLDEFYERIEALTDTVLGFDYISGFCYTQLTDVEQEQNGIYTYDRKAKFDSEKLKAILGRSPAWAE